MTATDTEIFETLCQTSERPAEMLARLVDHFRAARKPMELFEALKMQTRQRIGLPLLQGDEETPPPEELDRQMEQGLLAACREVGTMLLEDGRIREGWMYLRPTGDVRRAAELIRLIEVTDDNADELVQVLLHEGVDVGRGYQMVIDRQGTCNSITLFEQAIAARPKRDRQAAAARLLDHVYQELNESVRGDIARREAPAGEDENIATMVESRRWLLEGGSYHLDTTHLASTVRFARVLDQPEQLQKAWELTQYGRRLNHQLQYPGEEPFVDFYPASATFFSILLGRQVDSGLALFQRKAQSVDASQHGTEAIETYVDLLDRVGRPADALRAAIELVPSDVPPARLTPLLIELATKAKDFEPVKAFCRQRGDVLGYAAASALE